MQDKISVLLIYGLLGLLLALSPSLLRSPLDGNGASTLPLPGHRAGYWAPAIAAVFAVVLFIYTQAKNFEPVFLQDHLRHSGWLIIARSHGLGLDTSDDFDSVYDRTGRIDLGTVYAVRFSPIH